MGPAPTRRRRRLSNRATPARAVPLVPAIALLLVFLAGPIVWALSGSLTNRSLSGKAAANPEFIGFANYERLLSDPPS